MQTSVANGQAQNVDGETIDLRDPWVAAFLAWLIPGLGHWYQRRRSKALLLFVCILGTWIWGLYLGEGRVVYASLRKDDRRWAFFCQVGVGLPSMPALIQAARFSNEDVRAAANVRREQGKERFADWFMAPPEVGDIDRNDDRADELDLLHKRLHRYFELGTVYTMVAGLLNVLAIYDAWGGPAYLALAPAGRKDDDEPGKSQDPAKRGGK